MKLLLPLLLAMMATASWGQTPSHPGNDTGQTLCTNAEGDQVACSSPEFSGQDAAYGRDAAAVDGVLPQHGGGWAGFDFTKIGNNGTEVPKDAQRGSNPNQWACTQDNHTGLLWEIKIDDAASPRHHAWSFLWYSEDDEHNGGNPGFESGPSPECGFTLDCNTKAYVEHLNQQRLCGRTDWRVPSADEALGIIQYTSQADPSAPAVDDRFFADGFWHTIWTADSAYEPPDESAWAVIFDGRMESQPKGNPTNIRLVSGQRYDAQDNFPVCRGEENPQIRPSTAGAFTVDQGVAHDNRTGLTWSRCPLGQHLEGEGGENGSFCEGGPEHFEWQQALQMIRERNDEHYLGHDDWRLPNIKELHSIKELRCSMPMLDASVFPQDAMESFWTSTGARVDASKAWAINFELGLHVDWNKWADSPHVMLVRGGGPWSSYRGGLRYSVGGEVNGMVGDGMVLHLDAEGATDSLIVNSNGSFDFSIGLENGTHYEVSIQTPPEPHQNCTISNGSGTIDLSDVHDIAVSCAEPDPPQIAVQPADIQFELETDTTAASTVAISNIGGGILQWSIDTAYGPGAALNSAGIDCEAEPGILIHDDGTVENRYSGNPAWAGGVMIVDRFTLDSYPGSIGSVCLGLARSGSQPDMEFEIVVFADNGPEGGPGTELGAMDAVATNLPHYPLSEPQWYSYDISSLYTTIDSGSIYVGLRWQPGSNPGTFPLADESEDRPVGHAGGYYWNYSGSGEWLSLAQLPPGNYRSMFIRSVQAGPQELPTGCDNPNAVPWLDVTPADGQTNAGNSSTVDVTVDASGMAGGIHEALLCISSNDAANPLVQIPVTMDVENNEAFIEGTVSTPGYCSSEPAVLENATVEISSSLGTVYSATTDANGYYHIPVDASESPLDIGVLAADHIGSSTTGVTIAPAETETVDFDLLLDAPCAQVTPGSFNDVLTVVSPATSYTLTVDNSLGGGRLNWGIQEAQPTAGQSESQLDFCQSPSDVPWLSATPFFGSADGGMSSQVEIEVDVAGLEAGSYEAFICVHSDDTRTSLIPVPFNIEVESVEDLLFQDRFEQE